MALNNPTIDNSFVSSFQVDVHLAYQRMGSHLRGTVRTKNDITGKDTTFQKVGKGTAGTKSRHGKVPVMNLDHTPVLCTLEDHYAGEWHDKLDEIKIIHDEFQVIVDSASGALGRKTDEILVTAIESTSNTSFTGATLTNGIHLTDVDAIVKTFGDADIPDDGKRYGVVGWSQWGHLLALTAFSSTDYIGDNGNLPYQGQTEAKFWYTFTWFPYSGLTNDGTDTTCLFYHNTAIGHAIGAEITSDMAYHNDHASWFVNNMMSQGACLIDENGCYAAAVKNVLS